LVCLSSFSSQKTLYVSELAGLGSSRGVLGMTLTVSLLSIAGIPPLAGFYAKYLVFLSSIGGSMYVLSFIGVFTSVVGTFNYLRWCKIIWFDSLPKSVGSHLSFDEKLGGIGVTFYQG